MTARVAADRRLTWIGLIAVFILLDTILFKIFEPGGDWAPLWAAGRLAWTAPSSIYDFDLVSLLQSPYTGLTSGRPYIYPPTAQLLFAPLALLPFWISFAFYSLAATVLLCWAAAKEGSDVPLLLLSPPVVIAAFAGQPTLLVAALTILGLTKLGRDDILAGVLLAAAAAIKPQLFILAPFALITGRHWKAIAGACAAGVAMIGVSAIALGPRLWLDWIDALPRFQRLFADFEPLTRNAVSPYATSIRLGLESPWVIITAAVVAIPICALAFRRTADVALRSIALLGGALLISPYSMNYELALLAPAMICLPRARASDVAIPFIWAASLFANAGVVGLLAAYGWMVWRLLAPARQEATSLPHNRSMERGVYITS